MAGRSEYARLPGQGGLLYGRSLWLGSDHLLSVINRGYSEDYKRFYYKDVRAIQVRLTSTYSVINAVAGAFAAICILVQLLALLVWRWEAGGQIAFGFLTLFFVLPVLLNLIRGRTCVVHLYTAVHAEMMPSLNRLRTTNRALGRLQAQIESVQGKLTQEQAAMAGALEAAPSLLPEPSVSPPAVAEPDEDYGGHFHWSLFALLLFNALLAVVGSFYRTGPLQILNSALYVGIGICMIGALIRQRRSRMGPGLRRLAWVSAFYVWFVSVLGSLAAIFVLFQNGLPRHPGAGEVFRILMETVPADHPVLLALSLISASISLAIGLAGIVLMLQYRRGIP